MVTQATRYQAISINTRTMFLPRPRIIIPRTSHKPLRALAAPSPLPPCLITTNRPHAMPRMQAHTLRRSRPTIHPRPTIPLLTRTLLPPSHSGKRHIPGIIITAKTITLALPRSLQAMPLTILGTAVLTCQLHHLQLYPLDSISHCKAYLWALTRHYTINPITSTRPWPMELTLPPLLIPIPPSHLIPPRPKFQSALTILPMTTTQCMTEGPAQTHRRPPFRPPLLSRKALQACRDIRQMRLCRADLVMVRSGLAAARMTALTNKSSRTA